MKLKHYTLTEEDFERFRQLINQASGIFFDRGKWDILRLGLSERALAVGADTLSEYYEYITTDDYREEELRHLLEHLSVQETQFFRNLPQFDALRKFVIPEITRRKAGSYRNIRFWSAGCSTGQEPYSLAMSLLDVLPDARSWDIRVMGTDLNEQALDTARQGWYPERKLTGMDRKHIEQYMVPVDGGYRLTEEVRNMVEFHSLNLVTDPLPIERIGTCDVVFCRNVIIYFTHETAKFVVEHFFDILNPGGYLFLGHSETLWKMSNKYSLVEVGDAFIYRKSLPRGINGRRFISDRRMRSGPLPPGVRDDRRQSAGRRSERTQPLPESREAGEVREGAVVERKPEGEQEFSTVEEAKTLLELGDYDKAVTALEKALEANSTRAELHFLMGLAYEKRDELAAASESFRKTIYCDDRFSIAYFHIASILEHTGQLKAATREYRHAVRYLRQDDPRRWEKELDDYGVESLLDLCEWKIENLGGLDT
ncbi:chemotaxis protein methyltransferase Cher2 [bacterium BMS3Abin01]|nr:chemotaxis protein methyltransferase Cher2 [bacterium BMS3Abin01]